MPTTPTPAPKSKSRSIPLALLATLSTSFLAPTCPAQTTVQYSKGQNNTTEYDTSAPNNPLTLTTNMIEWATQSGRITGTGAVYKTGAGILYLTNASNSYSGGTYVRFGDLGISDAAVLGTGPVVITEGTIQGGSSNLIFNSSVSLIQPPSSGGRTFLITTGSLVFGTHTASTLTVTKGALAIGHYTAFGLGPAAGVSIGAVTDARSELVAGVMDVGAEGGAGELGVSNGGKIDVSVELRLGHNGGQGTVNLLTGGHLYIRNALYVSSPASAFNLAGGTLELGDRFTTSADMYLTNASAVLTDDINRREASLHGVLSGTGSLAKIGANTLRITAANTYSGGTVVSVGTLEVNNTSGSGTGTGTVTVAAGAALAGNFTISGATTIAGSLSAGDAHFGSDLTLTSTATTLLDLNSATSFNTIDVAGTLKLDGTIVIVTKSGYVVQSGMVFDLLGWSSLDAASFDISTDLDLSGTALAAGVTWDTSAFLTHGVLTAVPEPSTYALLALGVLGLCMHLFRRRLAY